MAEYTVAVFTVVDVRAVRAVAVFTDSAVIAVKAFIQLKFRSGFSAMAELGRNRLLSVAE